MTSTASSLFRRCAGVFAFAVIAAACSGGDDDAEPADTGAADTAVDGDDEDFTLAGTAVEDNEAGEVEPDASGDDAATLDEFCVASRPYYVQSLALQFIEEDDDAAAETLLRLMEDSAAAAAAAAPSADFAAPPQAAADTLAALLPALETVDFDIERLDELADSEQVVQLLATLRELESDLGEFLVDQCGEEPADLEQDARDLAAAVAGGTQIEAPPPGDDPDEGASPATTAAPDPDQPATTVADTAPATAPPTTESPFIEDIVEVEDDTGLIVVDVPASWSDTVTAPEGDLRQLGASADLDAFQNGFDEPGLYIISADVPDATAAWQAALTEGRASAEADGCTVIAENPYDDGVYEGTELLFSCPGTTAESRLIGGESPTDEIFFLLTLVVAAGDTDTYELIIDTFLVD